MTIKFNGRNSCMAFGWKCIKKRLIVLLRAESEDAPKSLYIFQACNNEDMIIKSSKTFQKSIHTNNVYIHKNFYGIKSTDIFDIIDLPEIELLKTEYQNISHYTKEITTNLKSQAYYLEDFDIVETTPKNMWPLLTPDGSLHYLNLHNRKLQMQSENYKYKAAEQNFELVLNNEVKFVKVLDFKNTQVLFVETEVENGFLARIYGVVQGNELGVVFEVETNGTVDVEAFVLPHAKKQCVILLSWGQRFSKIYCAGVNGGDSLEEFMNAETFEPIKVSIKLILQTLKSSVIIGLNGPMCE